ncbi:hypothetical protein N5J77_22775 [Sphingobium yanoikuyae]|jgi:hypothetical protein|uniref:DUF1648 domain-containing protein n=3 Tax=Sphingobium TaxID=165695 RepID=A0A9X7UBX9_SPHYA|nr:hypothetical protein [Sphingobium yanoikuyae]MDF0542851.1 hypothetical protein [Sphingobium arseniciresistens]PZU69014.1 MAG: hypothetical protein DI540_06850 [Sphingobium sp.]MDH2133961.1 hypothetical protein [Sphingobium yanoikuyae]MDH2151786.1 hypothetical protein [Sphingobium yanoikuyae]MDH2169337.1 hypothetical protein [Sphingobium yanoikuyae]
MMLGLILTAVTILTLAAISYRANIRYGDEDRLPMQWSFKGEVNWSAPRRWALAFTPILAVICISPAAILLVTAPPSEGDAIIGIAVLSLMGACFIAAHLFHLWLIDRTVTR